MHPHSPFRPNDKRQPSPRKERGKVRKLVTVVAALAILGGLVRLAFDDREALMAMPEPQTPGEQAQPTDARPPTGMQAPLLSRAMRTLTVGSDPAR